MSSARAKEVIAFSAVIEMYHPFVSTLADNDRAI